MWNDKGEILDFFEDNSEVIELILGDELASQVQEKLHAIEPMIIAIGKTNEWFRGDDPIEEIAILFCAANITPEQISGLDEKCLWDPQAARYVFDNDLLELCDCIVPSLRKGAFPLGQRISEEFHYLGKIHDTTLKLIEELKNNNPKYKNDLIQSMSSDTIMQTPEGFAKFFEDLDLYYC